MTKRQSWSFQGLLLLSSLSFVGAKGCVFDGDASLGSDGASSGENGGAANQAGSSPTSAGSSSSSAGSSSGSAGKATSSGKAGAGPVAGMSAGGSNSSGGTASSEGGAEPAAGGETSAGGAGSAVCALEIVTGPCDAAFSRYAYDAQAGQCVPFTFGGCEGNANNFATLEGCQAACPNLTCPSFLQTDTVYAVQPLNRPERACIVLDQAIKVSCSMLLNPTLTVPTNWPTTRCANRNGTSFYAGSTLPRAEGWTDCSPAEAELVDQAPSCSDL